jgi:hypothetical protein
LQEGEGRGETRSWRSAYGELAQLDEAHDELNAVALREAVDGALLLQLSQLLLKGQLQVHVI